MEFIKCPCCLGYNVVLNEKMFDNDFAYKCLTCGKYFNTSNKTNEFKIIKVKQTVERQLVFPPIKPSNLKGYECLICGSRSFDCIEISCTNCIFRKSNYELLINSNEGE